MLDDLTRTRARARSLPETWTVRHDARLTATGGRYAGIAALSEEWGIAETALMARWHLLRAGRGPDLSGEAADFRALCDLLTPQSARLCCALRAGTEMSSADLAARTGVSIFNVPRLIRESRDRIGPKMPWRLSMRRTNAKDLRFQLSWLGGAAS